MRVGLLKQVDDDIFNTNPTTINYRVLKGVTSCNLGEPVAVSAGLS